MHELAVAVKAMGGLRDDSTRDSLSEVREHIKSVRLRLVTHNEIEESHIYPLAASLLLTDEASGMHKKIKIELDNLPPRFINGAASGNDKTDAENV